MGASVSNSVASIMDTATTTIVSRCPANDTTNQVDFCAAVFNHCNGGKNLCDAGATISVSCSSGVVASEVQKAIAEASAKAQAGIGVAGAASQTAINSQINTMIDQQCGTNLDSNQDVFAVLDCIDSDNVTNEAISHSDKTTVCEMNAAASVLQSAHAKADADAEGWDPIGDIMKNLKTIIIVVCVVGVIGLIITVLIKVGGSKKAAATDATGAASKSPPKVPAEVSSYAYSQQPYAPQYYYQQQYAQQTPQITQPQIPQPPKISPTTPQPPQIPQLPKISPPIPQPPK